MTYEIWPGPGPFSGRPDNSNLYRLPPDPSRLVGADSEPSTTSLLASPITYFTFVNTAYLWPAGCEIYTWGNMQIFW